MPISLTCARKSLSAPRQPRENLIARQAHPTDRKGREGEPRVEKNALRHHLSRQHINHDQIGITSKSESAANRRLFKFLHFQMRADT
jgi:hypothetical protein